MIRNDVRSGVQGMCVDVQRCEAGHGGWARMPLGRTRAGGAARPLTAILDPSMIIPTEPIGSIPRPRACWPAVAVLKGRA